MKTVLPAERVNFWTHWLGLWAWLPFTMFLALVGGGWLSLSDHFWPQRWGAARPFRLDLLLVALTYGVGALFLFFCSSWYHKNKTRENERSLWRTLDHFAIFVMIAGSYTPIVWVWLSPPWREAILALQWGLTLLGFLFKVTLPHAPRWIDPVLYVLMGWVALFLIVPLYRSMPGWTFFDMILGGVWYTVGAVIYAFKRPRLWPGRFGFHELFHIMILGGAATHGSMVLRTLIAAHHLSL